MTFRHLLYLFLTKQVYHIADGIAELAGIVIDPILANIMLLVTLFFYIALAIKLLNKKQFRDLMNA